MIAHRFPYRWRLADGYPAATCEAHNATVFGTFICGGGSTMGYKLAGYRHLGGVEIDPKVADVYRRNHAPELLYVEDLRAFNARADLPPALYKLDLLDGSPPCSTFSMAGSREKAWGKKKVFREGQSRQTLDDLVYVYCDTVAKLRPKVCLLENVKGLVSGNARVYFRNVLSRLDAAGYRAQAFLLSAARMGVPQVRERVFVVGLRKDLSADLPPLALSFDEPPIPFSEIYEPSAPAVGLCPAVRRLWDLRRPGDRSLSQVSKRETGRNSFFSWWIASPSRVCPTLTACPSEIAFDCPRLLSSLERRLAASFPLDYDFGGLDDFLTGMSVPPVMAAHVAAQIYSQWLKPLKSTKQKKETIRK